MSEQTKAWVVVGPTGQIIYSSVRRTRAQAIDAFIFRNRWEFHRKRGYRCVRVTITPTKETP